MNVKFFKRIVILLVLLLAVYGIYKLIQPLLPLSSTISLSQTAVVTEIKSLSRLETATFTIEKIIQAGGQENAFQTILFGDKILLIAHANVIAGFDLSQFTTSGVSEVDSILRITLPPPEILVSRLDNQQTRVYDRQLGFLTKGDPTLESQARLAAETSIREAACAEGILSVASDNARKQLQTIFASAGFKEVVVNIPQGACN